MRILLTSVVAILYTSTAFAGMTPDQMRARIKELQVELGQLVQTMRVHTRSSIEDDLRDLDRRRFESDLDLAKLNARREVVLARAKDEVDRKYGEKSEIQQKLVTLEQQRKSMQDQLAKMAEKVDAEEVPSGELAKLKMALANIDAEMAKIKVESTSVGSAYSEILTDIEIDLAGVNAVRKALDQRSEELNRRYFQLGDLEAATSKLQEEQRMLIQELQGRGLPLE